METITRVIVLAAACALLWIVEGRRPLFAFGPERARHVGPNVVLAALSLVTNLGLAWVVRPVGPGLYPWPFWLQAVAGVAVLDLFAWLAHVVLHKTAWGWLTHRVHHCDVAVDVTTALRQHPGETVWRLMWRLVPMALLGIPLPVAALYETLSAANALLEHANLRVPERADRLARWLFVTPTMHKWHHSRDARQTDTNYGNILSVWDRLFGTFTGDLDLSRLRYGLDGLDTPEAQSLRGLLRLPYRSGFG